jgi:hypothetical protein
MVMIRTYFECKTIDTGFECKMICTDFETGYVFRKMEKDSFYYFIFNFNVFFFKMLNMYLVFDVTLCIRYFFRWDGLCDSYNQNNQWQFIT